MAEIHCHGNPLIVNEIISLILAQGAVIAGPGEFTQRAFENGKIDLTQAEAVSDLIHAESEESLRFAQEQLDGRLKEAIDQVGEPLRNTLAQIEAYIDFPDEDIEPQEFEGIMSDLQQTQNRIDSLRSTYRAGKIAREGFRVLLCGPPNAGKSSLLNALLGVARAIVTDVAGTTRDLIEERMNLDNFTVVLCDSAGLTATTNVVEQIGVELALNRIPWADLLLVVVDATRKENIAPVIEKIRAQLPADFTTPLWLILNKSDLLDHTELEQLKSTFHSDLYDLILGISVRNGEGVNQVRQELHRYLSAQTQLRDSQTSTAITNVRHCACLDSANKHLAAGMTMLRTSSAGLEIASEEVRIALRALEEIVERT